jgi:hypothetical protein
MWKGYLLIIAGFMSAMTALHWPVGYPTLGKSALAIAVLFVISSVALISGTFFFFRKMRRK